VTALTPTIARLKKRRDFLNAARGVRVPRRSFVLQVLERGDEAAPRLGFTVSKRTARKAVERNRIRRRLREAARQVAADAQSGHDYVLIGRRDALTEPFATLTSALAAAMRKSAGRDLRQRGERPQRSER
jgi:ribonuclease P protein component